MFHIKRYIYKVLKFKYSIYLTYRHVASIREAITSLSPSRTLLFFICTFSLLSSSQYNSCSTSHHTMDVSLIELVNDGGVIERVAWVINTRDWIVRKNDFIVLRSHSQYRLSKECVRSNTTNRMCYYKHKYKQAPVLHPSSDSPC